MRFSSVASLCAVTVAAFLIAPAPSSATSVLATTAGLSKPAATVGLMTEVKCVKVDGELKCGKKKHHSDNDDDNEKGKDKDKETKTVKLIKQQSTCSVHTPGLGGGGCTSPLIRRCDKLKDGDEVCCCYKVDDSQPAQ
jgi:hypothetical protein